MAEDQASAGNQAQRKLIYMMMVSLDGFVEGPDHNIDWITIDEEIHTFENDEARKLSVFLYGRRMYELMSSFWPTVEEDPTIPEYVADFAQIWRGKPKIVFSSTLEKVDWNSTLVKDDAAREIARLKSEPGDDMGIGGPVIASTAIRAGLVDEYRLLVHPVVLGRGTPYFPATDRQITLRLLETRTFRSGAVFLRYERDARG